MAYIDGEDEEEADEFVEEDDNLIMAFQVDAFENLSPKLTQNRKPNAWTTQNGRLVT